MVIAPSADLFAGLHTAQHQYRFLLRGAWHAPRPGQTFAVRSPTDGALVGEAQAMSVEDIDVIFADAAQAQPAWAARPADERARILMRAADLLERHAAPIAEVLVREIAKGRRASRDEVLRSADFLRFTAEEGRHLAGESLFSDAFPGEKRNKVGFTVRVPLGVVLAIAPFNYPVNLAVSKIAPALMAGNACVYKPPTQGTISAHYLAAVFREAGIPADVFQLATGPGAAIGDYLVTHPGVNMITFTGSSATGRQIAKLAGMVPLTLELGGKDAAIVLRDADLDLAAAAIVSGAFAYSGQRCTAVKRVLVADSVADDLIARVVPAVATLTVGRPEDDATVTPLITDQAADYVDELIDDAVARGGDLLLPRRREGSLLWPTVVDRVSEAMRLAWEEPFGPVLPILRVANAAEAVRIANRSEYGLQSSLFSRDVDATLRIAAQLEVGTVQVNGKTSRGPDHFPFVGTKSSGLGTQGIRYSLESMTRVKSIVFNLSDERRLEEIT
jgi:glyceraldehyde-3-phosphate dehydrogenase (NADP+)